MKKLLIATAALAMVAGTAQAQSTVTVYGVLDTGYNSLENKTTSTGTSTTTERNSILGQSATVSGEAATSRLGFRGTEDLGGGMKANFVLESGILQNTAMTFGGRAFWAGLEDSKMGELRIGRQDTFGRTTWLSHDQLAFANVAGNLAHDGNGSEAAKTSHTNRSVAVNYLSPRMSGAQLSLGLTQDDSEKTGTEKSKNGSGSQVGLSYVAGKFSAGVAYVEATTDTAAVTGVAGSATANYVKAADASSLKAKDTVGGLSYDLGVAKVAYVYNKREVVNAKDKATTNNSERESHAFSASVPLTAKLIGRLGYGFGEYREGATSAYTGDIKGYQAALNYNLSKRTMVYGIYGNEKRDISTSSDVESKEYSVGVRHLF